MRSQGWVEGTAPHLRLSTSKPSHRPPPLTNERNPSISILLYLEALPLLPLGGGRLQLRPQLGQPALELTQVVLSGLDRGEGG